MCEVRSHIILNLIGREAKSIQKIWEWIWNSSAEGRKTSLVNEAGHLRVAEEIPPQIGVAWDIVAAITVSKFTVARQKAK